MSSIPEETSLRITALRFLLAVLVVFGHNNFTAQKIADSVAEGGKDIIFCPNATSAWIQAFISSGIGRCAVPLFFLFSAYLLAKKCDPYRVMLKKKSRSLLVPYVAWLIVYFVWAAPIKIAIAKAAPSLLANPQKLPFSDGMSGVVKFAFGFISKSDGNPEFAGQFWFVRDLFFFSLLSPFLLRLIRIAPTAIFALSAGFFVFGASPAFDAHLCYAQFFYIAGLFWGTFDIAVFKDIDKIRWCEILPIFAFSFILECLALPGLSPCTTIFSCVIFLKCSNLICGSEKVFAIAERLAPLSFFLFAFHMPALLYISQKVWLAVLPMKNAFFCLAEYFGVSLIIIAFATAVGQALRKFCPPVFALLNGGRG